MKKILISGSLAFDHIMKTDTEFSTAILPDQINKLSAVFCIQEKKTFYGGTAGNIAYNLALLDYSAIIVASLGKDGTQYLDYLKNKKIICDNIVQYSDVDTASAYILNDKNHCQITMFYPGAMNKQSQFSLEKIKEDSIMIIAPDDIANMENYACQCQKNKIPYIFDPGQNLQFFTTENLVKSIKGSDFLIINEYESELIQKKINMDEILGMTKKLIVTLGKNGSLIREKNKNDLIVNAYKVDKEIDSTGCGDAFRAGLLYGIINDWNLEKAAKLGSLLAKFSIQEYGTQNHKPTLSEIEAEFNEKIFN